MDASHIRDRELIARIIANDTAALSDLLRAHAEWLTRSVIPIVHSVDLAQDVVQDIFIWLWNTRSTLDIRGSVPAYLYRAARNRAHNVVVHEQSQRNIEARTLAAHGGVEPRTRNTGESNLHTQDFYTALSAALETLPPRAREIFLLRAEHGLSYPEIAEALEIGVPTVHTQMYRATKALAEQLRGRVSDF